MKLGLAVALMMIETVALAAEPIKTDAPGVLVAVGYGGRRMVSADGKEWRITAEWAEMGGDDSDNLISIVYAKDKFVAVGGGTPKRDKAVGGHIVVSTDGTEWKEVYTAKSRVSPVLYGNDRFVAGGPGKSFLYATDGETWKEGAKLTAKEATHFRQGAFGNGVFVFIGNHGGNSVETWVAVTKDGEKLEHIAVDLPPVRGLTFANGRFVAVGPNGMTMTSKDGQKWIKAEALGEGDLAWIVWSGKEFVCGGGKAAFHSADGSRWEKWPTAIHCSVNCVSELGWIGSTWPGQMWFSGDGLKWEKCKALTPNGINRVVFGKPAVK